MAACATPASAQTVTLRPGSDGVTVEYDLGRKADLLIFEDQDTVRADWSTPTPDVVISQDTAACDLLTRNPDRTGLRCERHRTRPGGGPPALCAMPPYAVKVFSDDPCHPIETLYVRRACRVMALLPVVLARHASCHRVRVYAGETLLFSVDGRGEDVFD